MWKPGALCTRGLTSLKFLFSFGLNVHFASKFYSASLLASSILDFLCLFSNTSTSVLFGLLGLLYNNGSLLSCIERSF